VATLTRALPALFLAAAACGDALAPSDYAGTSRLMLAGSVQGSSPAVDLYDPFVRASVFWAPRPITQATTIDDLLEQPSNGTRVRVPGPFTWNLFEEPEAAHFTTARSGARYALGLVFLYRDFNGDGVRQSDDTLVADAPATLILFAPAALAAADSPTGFAAPAGYHLIGAPLPCSPPGPPPDGDCGVPVGVSCGGDADCGANGICLVDDPWPWPGGTCAVVEPPPSGCRPRGAALFRHPSQTDHNTIKSYWVKACSAASDCPRGPPYQCDFGHGACLPTLATGFSVKSQVTVHPVCLPPR
jgi:hypothetical protein